MAPCLENGDATPNRIVTAQLSKTKMCIKFTNGLCKESECRFAHSPEELRELPNLSKTAMCRAFARGSCFDTECKYAHGEEELRVSPNIYKTQLCNFFAKGHCRKGDSCRHAHGRKELRISQEAILPLPIGTESLVATPKRGTNEAQTPLADASNRSRSNLPEHVFQTPVKPRKTGAAQSPSMRCSGPFALEAAKKSLPNSSVAAAPPFFPPIEIQEVVLPPPPGLAVPWHLEAAPDVALTDCFAKAAAAATMSAQQHTMAANAASAAMTWALMHTYLSPGTSKINKEVTLETQSFSSQPATEDRKWVL